MKSEGNITSPKDHNNLLLTELKDMEICNLPNKEFKMAVFKEANWVTIKYEENSMKSGKQYMNIIRLNKEIEIIKKEPNRNSWLKNTMKWKMK